MTTKSIVSVFEKAKGHLADRMLAGLKGGLDAGGEAGPIHSAGIKISHQVPWPIIDLRCDWTEECPITKQSEIWKIYKPQVPKLLGLKTDYKISVEKIEKFIDWKPFFQSWELHGNFPEILNDEKVGKAAKDLWNDAQVPGEVDCR